MQLTHFSVERYRSLTSLSEFKVSDLTVLVGPNNEGKSNVLRALNCALNLLKFYARRSVLGTLKQRTLIYKGYLPPYYRRYKWKDDYPIQYQKSGKKDNSSVFVMTFTLNSEESQILINGTKIQYPFKQIPIKLQINKESVRISVLIPELFQHSGNKRIVSYVLKYIAQQINICYIDAERTAELAKQSIEKLIDLRVEKLQSDPVILNLMEKMKSAFNQEMQEISKQVNHNLKMFIPSIKKTDVLFLDEDDPPFASQYEQFNIDVDDGITTALSQKGSGVQSLVALFLANYVSNAIGHSDNFILAVDEPESHLHPSAIHNVEKILKNISKNNQVIISTHSPILVQTFDPHKNVIVKDNRAKEASRISEIREILGSRPADNLINAELVLIVEGTSDENIFSYLLSDASDYLREAIEGKRLIVSSAGGTHNLDNYIRFMKNNLYAFHVLVDDDTAGKDIIRTLISQKIIDKDNYTVLKMGGLKHSEIEDLINPEIYAESIKKIYNISSDIVGDILHYKSKWSIKIKKILEKKGKEIKEDDMTSLKIIVSEAVKIGIKDAYLKDKIIIPSRNESFIELVKCLEKTLISR